MSYDRQRRIRRPFQEPVTLPDPIDGAVGDARAAGEQGYTSVARDINGNVESAVNPLGQRTAFSGGLSPEQSATAQIRAGGATATTPPASRVGGTVTLETGPSAASVALNHPTGAATALNRPTNAAVALNRPTNAALALAKAPTAAATLASAPTAADRLNAAPTAADALAKASTPGAPARTFLGAVRQSGPVVLAGSAAESAAAVGEAGRAFKGINPPAGFVGKIGQVAAAVDPHADATSHLGTTVVPGGKGKPGFVTTGAVDPNGPADGGTGISVGGVAQVKRADGFFADATPAKPGVPPLIASRNSLASTGAYGGALKSLDEGPAIRAPLAPVTSTPAPVAASPATLEPGIEAGQSARKAVGDAFAGVGAAATAASAGVADAVRGGINRFRGFLNDTSPLPTAKAAGVDESRPEDTYYASQSAKPQAPSQAPGPGLEERAIARNSNLGRTPPAPSPVAASAPGVPLTTLPAISPVPSPRALTLGLDPEEIERRRKAASPPVAAAF